MVENKKIVLILIALLLICGCSVNKKETKMYSDLKKVTPYLYEITYDNYVEDVNLTTVSENEAFGCSSVRNGNYYGRNFDFIFNDVPEFIVRVKATKTRHASIGVATHMGLREDKVMSGYYDKQLELIPNLTLDGINDSGVICSYNVVPYSDVSEVTGTNPNGKDLHMIFIPRFVLDNASSADEAIELLKERNIYGSAMNNSYYLHIMIADENKTYVVEFIDNKMVVEEKKNNERIMTNYYVNLPYLTENSAGIERLNILKENYNEGNTLEGMMSLLKRVRYSNIYRFDNEEEFYSEYIPQSKLNNKDSEEFKNMLESLERIKKEYWVARAENKRNPSNPSFWFTTHNSTYDISKRMLRVIVQEDYNKYYDYYLDK